MSQASRYTTESFYNHYLSDATICSVIRSRDEESAYSDHETGELHEDAVERVRHHLTIVEGEIDDVWPRHAKHYGLGLVDETDDYKLITSDWPTHYVGECLREHNLDEGDADALVLAGAIDEVVKNLDEDRSIGENLNIRVEIMAIPK